MYRPYRLHTKRVKNENLNPTYAQYMLTFAAKNLHFNNNMTLR
jgi:hypothetical protein